MPQPKQDDNKPKPIVSHIWSATKYIETFPLLTVASLRSDDGKFLAYGVALCGPTDQPSRPRGREIAAGRARVALTQFQAGVRNPGFRGTQPNISPLRHAWVVRAEDLDPPVLIRDLRAFCEDFVCGADEVHARLAEQLDTLVDKRITEVF